MPFQGSVGSIDPIKKFWSTFADVKTLGITTFSLTTLSITTLSITGKNAALSIMVML
jgi:hypothetical protein